ncbi:MAG TPA: hypothetical protein VH481_01050 [Nitrososphaeraceae archaeon]|jgi:hypothetical protein
MPRVTTIFVRLTTRNAEGAGTDGNVFLGIGGIEIAIDSSKNDFEQGDDRTYIIGTFPTVLPSPHPTRNKY